MTDKVTRLPSNYSAKEIMREVRHRYPNLDGPLLDLLELVEDEIVLLEMGEDSLSDREYIKCPHCGSELKTLEDN